MQCGDALVAIDHQIALLVPDDDHWCLLARFSQGAEQTAESGWVADPEMLQAAVQLMKLQGLLRHGFQYAADGIWSFPADWGCCEDLPLYQSDSGRTGLSWRFAGVCS